MDFTHPDFTVLGFENATEIEIIQHGYSFMTSLVFGTMPFSAITTSNAQFQFFWRVRFIMNYVSTIFLYDVVPGQKIVFFLAQYTGHEIVRQSFVTCDDEMFVDTICSSVAQIMNTILCVSHCNLLLSRHNSSCVIIFTSKLKITWILARIFSPNQLSGISSAQRMRIFESRCAQMIQTRSQMSYPMSYLFSLRLRYSHTVER